MVGIGEDERHKEEKGRRTRGRTILWIYFSFYIPTTLMFGSDDS
jgi:hypothetical protein